MRALTPFYSHAPGGTWTRRMAGNAVSTWGWADAGSRSVGLISERFVVLLGSKRAIGWDDDPREPFCSWTLYHFALHEQCIPTSATCTFCWTSLISRQTAHSHGLRRWEHDFLRVIRVRDLASYDPYQIERYRNQTQDQWVDITGGKSEKPTRRGCTLGRGRHWMEFSMTEAAVHDGSWSQVATDLKQTTLALMVKWW